MGVQFVLYEQRVFQQTLAVFLLSGHLDHGLRWSVEEDEFLKQRLLELHLSCLSNHKNVRAQLQDPVHTRQLLKHDGPGDPVKELPDKLSDDQHHWHVQAYDAVVKKRGAMEKKRKTVSLVGKCSLTEILLKSWQWRRIVGHWLSLKGRSQKYSLTKYRWDDLLPTHVQPESPHWRGWLYHWTLLSQCCDTCVRRRRGDLGGTPPPPTTDLPLMPQ